MQQKTNSSFKGFSAEKSLCNHIEIKQEKWGALLDYSESVTKMQERLHAMTSNNNMQDFLWLLEHQEIYTVGSMGYEKDIVCLSDVPVAHSCRGGKVTYHGPGQRIVYSVMNLRRRYGKNANIRDYIFNLEEVIIRTLYHLGVQAKRRPDAPGVWIGGLMGWKKIASIGVRVKNWITLHGIALNIDCDLNRFKNIVPCGIKDAEATSLQEMGLLKNINKDSLDALVISNFLEVFDISV